VVSPRTGHSQEYLRNGSSHQPSRRLPGKLSTPSVDAATVCSDGGRGLAAKLLRGGFRPRTLSREYLPNRRSPKPSRRLPGKLSTPSVDAATVCSDGGRRFLARGGFSARVPTTKQDSLSRTDNLSKTTLPFFILDGNFTAPDRQRTRQRCRFSF
jgi:hypothetical protein